MQTKGWKVSTLSDSLLLSLSKSTVLSCKLRLMQHQYISEPSRTVGVRTQNTPLRRFSKTRVSMSRRKIRFSYICQSIRIVIFLAQPYGQVSMCHGIPVLSLSGRILRKVLEASRISIGYPYCIDPREKTSKQLARKWTNQRCKLLFYSISCNFVWRIPGTRGTLQYYSTYFAFLTACSSNMPQK